MGVLVSKSLIQDTYLPLVDAAHYTVPANTKTVVKEIILCNTDVVAVAVTLNYMKSAGTLAKGTILSALSLAAGETKLLSLSSVLNAADAIHGLASVANKVVIYASGYEENV